MTTNLMKFLPKKSVPKISPGKKNFEWEAYDYHPHQRGVLWYICFCAVFFGGAAWAIMADPEWGWLTAFVFLVAVAIYFWKHLNPGRTHRIQVFKKAIVIDTEIIPIGTVGGYWFVFDDTVSVINLELKEKNGQKISLQMGDHLPEWFRSKFSGTGLSELENRKEPLLDLWIRALKL